MSAIFSFIQNVFALPLGFILSQFYNLTNNYIVAIVLLTIVVKLCFLPMSISQQKNAIKTAELNAKIAYLKTYYAARPEKQKEKVAALKKRDQATVRSFGFLRTLVQFIVLIGLFGVIYAPLSIILKIDQETISAMQEVVATETQYVGAASAIGEITLLSETANLKEIFVANNILTLEQANSIIYFNDQYNFFGMNLSGNPAISHFDALWLAPGLVLLTGLITAVYAIVRRRKQLGIKGKFMVIESLQLLPSMLLFLLSFTVSAGIGLYWSISSGLTLIQTIILDRIYNPLKISISLSNIKEFLEPEEPASNLPTETNSIPETKNEATSTTNQSENPMENKEQMPCTN